MIVGVAIRGEGTCVHAMYKPYRHHDIIREMVTRGHAMPVTGEQGFIDDERGFVDRREAAKIAIDQGQVTALGWPPKLQRGPMVTWLGV